MQQIEESNKIKEMRRDMENKGIYIKEDIDKICTLYAEYEKDCDDIARDCSEEGYPSRGSNYELRCSMLWTSFYQSQLYDIDSKYPELDEEYEEDGYEEYEEDGYGDIEDGEPVKLYDDYEMEL